MHHASICVNVVIGVLVVLCELHVIVRVHVIPLCGAVVGLTLGLIAHVVVVVFVVAILHRRRPCPRTARQEGREEEVFGSLLFRLFFLFLLLRSSKSRARSIGAAACCCDSFCFTCSLAFFSSSFLCQRRSRKGQSGRGNPGSRGTCWGPSR